MVEDHVVVEGQPVHRRAGWRSHRQRHPHVGFLLDDRDHLAHRHRPGPPVGSRRVDVCADVFLELLAVLPHRLNGVLGNGFSQPTASSLIGSVNSALIWVRSKRSTTAELGIGWPHAGRTVTRSSKARNRRRTGTSEGRLGSRSRTGVLPGAMGCRGTAVGLTIGMRRIQARKTFS